MFSVFPYGEILSHVLLSWVLTMSVQSYASVIHRLKHYRAQNTDTVVNTSRKHNTKQIKKKLEKKETQTPVLTSLHLLVE